jgi:membrane protease YdiL (CAAX protease family)
MAETLNSQPPTFPQSRDVDSRFRTCRRDPTSGSVAGMSTDEPKGEASRQFFLLGCAVEGSLFVLGAGLSGLFGQGFLANLHWSWRDAVTGLWGSIPPLGLFLWAIHSRWEPLQQIRRVLDQLVWPIIRHWHIGQILIITTLAGLGEEFLFRAAVQGGLSHLVGPIPALILAGLIFGGCHPMTWGYLILTSLMGVYLGALWLWTGNLLVPVLIHAIYDFVAMVYLLSIKLSTD